MTKNKRQFIVNIIGAILIFLLGVIYIMLPTYYGTKMMENIDINNLFLSFLISYSVIHLGEYLILGKNPHNEPIYLCIIASITGILNIILSGYSSKSFSISFALMIFMITAIKLLTIDYYHDRDDAYYYIEGLCTAIFFILGVICAINFFGNVTLQTIMLGLFITIIGILEIFNVSIKTMLKSKRFLKKIKLK